MKLYRCDLAWTASTYVLAADEKQAEEIAQNEEFDHDRAECYSREITKMDQVHVNDHDFIPASFDTNPDDRTIREVLTLQVSET